MTKLVAWFKRRLGRRGAALATLSVAFLLLGLRAAVAPVDPEPDRILLHTLMPHQLRAAMWIVPAVIGLAAAFRRTGRDWYGFAALTVPLTILWFSYTWSFVCYLVGATDYPLAWTSGVIWFLVLALVLNISGWAEVKPDTAPTLSEEDK